jgi:chromosome segregation ATPase
LTSPGLYEYSWKLHQADGAPIKDGAETIGKLGQPLLDLSALLSKTPEILEGQAERQAQGEDVRNTKLLAQTESLVKAVADAASKFSEVDSLAEHLSRSAEKLRDSGSFLENFGKELGRSSEAQTSAAASSERAAAAGLKAAQALLPIPERLEGMTGRLEDAGSTIKEGAIAARDAYGEAANFQRQWFEGVEIGLKATRDQLNKLIASYGTAVEGETSKHMMNWTKAVEDSLKKFSVQIQRVEGAIQDVSATKKRP